MKVVHLNTTNSGGAGIAARNLHLALLERGIDSNFVCKYNVAPVFEKQYILAKPLPRFIGGKFMRRLKASILSRLKISESLEGYYLKGRVEGFDQFSFPWSDLNPQDMKIIKEADVIHMHWISDGFIDYNSIALFGQKKIVWTLHDMNPFTGGCHHSDGCVKFESNCNFCYMLKGTRNEYISHAILNYKINAMEAIAKENIQIITPSVWLSKLSQKSKLFSRFNHKVIKNMNSFSPQPVNTSNLRLKYNINFNVPVFIFVAHHFDNPRKGLHVLLEAFNELENEEFVVLAIGEKLNKHLKHGKLLQFGYVKDMEVLKELYTLADAFILPSLAENFPNTIVEALLCGTPVIATDVGGIPEQINEKNGILVEKSTSESWKNAILQFINKRSMYNRAEIKKQAEIDYNNEEIVNKHIELYKTLIG